MSEEGRPVKPGYRTTEFWLTMVLVLVGAYMVAVKGDVDNGKWLLLTGIGIYTGARAIAKWRTADAS